jgi:uncharacterized protein YjcR
MSLQFSLSASPAHNKRTQDNTNNNIQDIRRVQREIFIKQTQLLSSSSIENKTPSESFDSMAKAFESRDEIVTEISQLVRDG